MQKETKLVQNYAEIPSTATDIDVINSVPLSKACKEAFEKLSKDDAEPFQFVQELKFGEKHPAHDWDSSIYTKEWADSYAEKANKKPIPGSAYGHQSSYSGKRQENHVYVIGAKVTDDETMLLRHYITRDMAEHEYNKLVKEMKAGLLSTSTVCAVDWKVEKKDNKEQVYIIKSVGNERNDIVEWNQCGQNVKTVATNNKKIDSKGASMTLDEAIALVKENATTLGVEGSADLANKLGFTVISKEQKETLELFDKLNKETDGIEEFVKSNLEQQKETIAETVKSMLNKELEGSEEAIAIATDIMSNMECKNVADVKKNVALVANMESVKKAVSNSLSTRDPIGGTVNTSDCKTRYDI